MRCVKLLSIAFLCVSLRSQPGKKKNVPDQQQIAPNNEQTKPSVTIINQLYPQSEDRDKAKSENHQGSVAILEAVSTFLLFTATAALCYVAVLQRRTMVAHKQSLEAMATHMEKGLAETRKAADATAKQFELTERPWLSVQVEPESNLRWGNVVALEATVKICNSGKSPALSVISRSFLHAIKSERPESLLREVCTDLANGQRHPYAVFPNDCSPWSNTFSLDRNEALANSVPGTGHVHLVLITCVAYRPSFSDDVVYCTATIHSFGYGDGRANAVPTGANIPRGELLVTRIYPPLVMEIRHAAQPERDETA